MSTVPLVEYQDASPEVQAIFDEIKQARNVPDVNNFWKALANHPDNLRRIWASLRDVMQPGALDGLTKELLYIAVSITNKCDYCTYSHTAAAFAKGMSAAQYQELLAVVGMAHQTNALATGLKVPVDPQFMTNEKKSPGTV
ncbi:MAG: carboxymuconolactone decarboxylase family protein [Candidatus Binatia bacterium]